MQKPSSSHGSNQGLSQEFVIPEPSAFSTPTMMFLLGEEKDKYLLSKAVRIEIVAVLANLMMIQTRFPKSEDYNIVCQKLVERYPRLQDVIGNGYVSIPFAARQFVEILHTWVAEPSGAMQGDLGSPHILCMGKGPAVFLTSSV